jgi:regulator of sigma E protease
MDFMITLLQFFGALCALIIIHELGHYLAARAFKVEIDEFGIFFPPRLLTLFTFGGTKFTLNAIPLGGFVRPKGDNDPEVEGGLAAASPWKRLVILAAGPAANILVAVILYATIFSRIGSPDFSQVQIADVAENSPAMQAGLLPGDIVREVGGRQIDSPEAIQSAIQANLDQETRLVYIRNEAVYETTLTPRSSPPEGQGAIGIIMGHPTQNVGWLEALPYGFQGTARHIEALVMLPVSLARGELSAEEGRLVGFKGMLDIYQEVREGELHPGVPTDVSIMAFFTNITISLGILNLFPFPALDGGRILFTLPEIVLRRRIPPQYENVINLVGFAILILLLIYINLQDFLVPVTLPR